MENNVFKSLTENQALFNGRIKLYQTSEGEKIAQTMVCDKAIFNPNKLEKQNKKTFVFEKNESHDSEKNPLNFERSARRAKSKLYDIVMCNEDFKYFVTLTISPDTADRTDYKAILKKLSTWLDNRVRQNGLKYALVPEYHADGKSIHFHGFFNNVLKTFDSGKKTKDGKIIYNLPQFKFGFTTAIEITGEYIATCRYILKYVGKSGEKVGGRFYLSGGDLNLPRYEYFNAEFSDIESGYTFSPEGSGLTFRVSHGE